MSEIERFDVLVFGSGAGGFKNVGLVFREEKLAMFGLQLDTKANKVLAADIPNEYGVPFRPIFKQMDYDAMWMMWDQASQEARPRQYPAGYYLLGVSPDSDAGVIASITNMPSFGRQMLRDLNESMTMCQRQTGRIREW